MQRLFGFIKSNSTETQSPSQETKIIPKSEKSTRRNRLSLSSYSKDKRKSTGSTPTMDIKGSYIGANLPIGVNSKIQKIILTLNSSKETSPDTFTNPYTFIEEIKVCLFSQNSIGDWKEKIDTFIKENTRLRTYGYSSESEDRIFSHISPLIYTDLVLSNLGLKKLIEDVETSLTALSYLSNTFPTANNAEVIEVKKILRFLADIKNIVEVASIIPTLLSKLEESQNTKLNNLLISEETNERIKWIRDNKGEIDNRIKNGVAEYFSRKSSTEILECETKLKDISNTFCLLTEEINPKLRKLNSEEVLRLLIDTDFKPQKKVCLKALYVNDSCRLKQGQIFTPKQYIKELLLALKEGFEMELTSSPELLNDMVEKYLSLNPQEEDEYENFLSQYPIFNLMPMLSFNAFAPVLTALPLSLPLFDREKSGFIKDSDEKFGHQIYIKNKRVVHYKKIVFRKESRTNDEFLSTSIKYENDLLEQKNVEESVAKSNKNNKKYNFKPLKLEQAAVTVKMEINYDPIRKITSSNISLDRIERGEHLTIEESENILKLLRTNSSIPLNSTCKRHTLKITSKSNEG